MINFEKMNMNEVQELQTIISKNSEKSELEKSYLYTNDTLEKAKIYVWCFRFLYSIRNLSKDDNLKKVLDEEIKLNDESYVKVCNLLHRTEKGHFNKHRNLDKLRVELLENDDVDDMIDEFALLLEKTNILSMSRLKGIHLEGNSGKEFKKIFEQKPSDMVVSESHQDEVFVDPPEPLDEDEINKKENENEEIDIEETKEVID